MGGKVLTTWPGVAALVMILHLDAFFSGAEGGHFPGSTCAQVYPFTQGLCVGLMEEGLGPSFPK